MPKDPNNIDDVIKVAESATQDSATFDDLIRKPQRSLTFTVTVGDEDDAVSKRIKYIAIPPKAYDKLVSEHPPTGEDKRNGALYNLDTFAPALIAAVSASPRLSYDQAKQLWEDPNWSSGELTDMFLNAQRVCNSGLDVSFNARG